MRRLFSVLFFLIAFYLCNAQQINLTYLPDIVAASDQDIQQEFFAYFDALTGTVSSEVDIIIIFEMRDSLMLDLQKVIETHYYSMNQQQYQTWEKLEIELDTIGFRVVYSEGIFAGLNVANILTSKINRYGSEQFKLYENFRNMYSKSLGGKGPYSNVYAAFDAIYAGEELMKDFPQSHYAELIKEDFMERLFLVTDIHKATTSSNGVTGCYYSDFTYQQYPYFSDCSAIEKIIIEKPNSMFVPILDNIYNNMSEILIQENKPNELSVMYAIVIDKSDSRKVITEKIYNYLLSGKDIVHNLAIDNGSVTEYYTCYRFFSRETKANAALDTIKADFPEAKVVELVLVDPYLNAKMRNNQ